MDQTHLHLVANHLPVIGSFIGIFVLIYGMVTFSVHTKRAACFIFILCAAGAALTFLTGEAAEEKVEHLKGISESVIEVHEETAAIALTAMIALGIASIISLFISFKKSDFSKYLSFTLLIIATISFSITVYTANLGGKIRHTELSK
jgi:uncharacterized membrane protein